MNKTEKSITDYFPEVANIAVYNNGKKSLYFKGDDKFEGIFAELKTATSEAHDMPAFGVSLDNETIKAKQSGVWIELVFDETKEFNEMPFDCLLFEIKPDDSGINLIRKHNGKYDGRCFYLNLNKNLERLFEKIVSLFEA